MLSPSIFERLKKRKIVQWALAYVAGAFAALQLLDALAEPLGLSAAAQRVVLVLVLSGFFLALVFAWYHGEKGRQVVSGTELALVTALVVATAGGVRMVWRAGTGFEAAGAPGMHRDDRSVAVLPLDNLSSADEHSFFGEAMTEEITSALAQVPELTVKSRTSAAKFLDSGMSIAEFARTLGVVYVIQGSVQRSGDRVRIAVQMVDARREEVVWAETYERQLLDLFNLQVEVARQVAERSAASFSDRERARILAAATENPVAYDRYLQAGAVQSDLSLQLQLLREAVEHDPMLWPAWERLGFSYLEKEARGDGAQWADSSQAAFRRAIQTAEHPPTRLRLEAYQAMIFQGDEEGAIARLRAAAEESPSDLTLVTSLGDLYRIRGRLTEAVRWRRQAAMLDPLDASRWQALFQVYFWLRMYDEAAQTLERAHAVDPENAEVWQQFAWNWMVQGRFEKALEAADSAASLVSLSGRGALFDRALVLWWAGDFEAAAASYSESASDPSVDLPEWQLIPMAHAQFAVGDSALGHRMVEDLRNVLESRVIEDYEPEWRVFPRLQLAAIEGDVDRAVTLFRLYVARGGRDPTWFYQSPLFSELRNETAILKELAELDRRVRDMRRSVVRNLAQEG